MHWGINYRRVTLQILVECVRVLRPGGLFIANHKDHIRAGKIIPVTEWLVMTLQALGFAIFDWEKIELRGMRHGQNHAARVPYESVIGFRKVRDW